MSFNLLTSFTRRCASSFFNRRSAEQLWKSVFSVSPQGRKKGRGRGARIRDLNRGQRIGDGPIRAILPGFDKSPLSMEGQAELFAEPKYFPPDPDRQARILEKQQDLRRKRKAKMHPLLRGYSGAGIAGRKLGWPMVDAASPTMDPNDPIAQDAREQLSQFETVCLWMKRRRIMTTIGRVPEIICLMAVGNGQGLAGFATAVDKEPRGALRLGTSAAIKRLQFVERLNNRTVYQDFFAECEGVRLFGRRVHEGHGLRCHRAIRLLCQLVGIRDIHVKVEGNTRNYINITKAFFTALVGQETHQQLADRKRLLVVELRREFNYIPTIIAKPRNAECRKEEELTADEMFDVDELYGEGRYPYAKKKSVPFYEYLDSWKRKLWREHPFRNMDETRIRLKADNVLPDSHDETKERISKEWHDQVLKGERPLPIGFGLSDIFTRDDWGPRERKKQ